MGQYGRITVNNDDKIIVLGLINDLEHFTAYMANGLMNIPIWWETMLELQAAVEKVGFVLDCIAEQAEELV